MAGRFATRIGDCSNNVAEYMGVLAALRDAVNRPQVRSFRFQVDSVAKQLNCLWRCSCPDLLHFYRDSLDLLEVLRRRCADVIVAHIYREFNAEADSLANEALDGLRSIIQSAWLGA